MSRKKKARFSREFKVRAVERTRKGESVQAVAEELEVRRKLLYEWREAYRKWGEAGLRQAGRPRREEAEARTGEGSGGGELVRARKRIAELERKVGQQELEIDFFGEALRRVEAAEAGGQRSTRLSRRGCSKAD